MKPILPFFFFLAGSSFIPPAVVAQVTDATVCEILTNPQSFDGKMVRIKGTVVAGFEEFAINGPNCGQTANAIWLSYPEGTHGKAGPAALLRLQLAKNHTASAANVSRTAITLEKNSDFKTFDKMLSTPAKTSGLCLGCVKFTANATLVGRLDGTKDAGFIRDNAGKVIGLGGFGHLNRYRARLVLQSVSDVSPQEMDYAGGGKAATPAAGSGAFTPAGVSADQVKRGADAFGAPREDNGVNVGFGGANEVPSDDTLKANANSPDGLLFTATFDGERVKGAAMQIALAHLGTHIADIRSTSREIATLPPYGVEFRGWQTTLLAGVGAKAKTVAMPGGYVLFSQDWANADLGKNANDAILGFLENWAMLVNPAQ